MRVAFLFVTAACSVTGSGTDRPEPLAPLPPPAHVETERFRDAEACGQCHLVADDTPVLHDADGANVSPVLLWRSSLMANAARDPYYLAVVAEELARAPAKTADIEKLCTRCHGPAGSEELADSGSHVSFDELTAGTSPAATLARGGVTCTLCHQITSGSLDGDSAFAGKFAVGYQRKIFGAYSNPMTQPMMLIVNYEPTYGAHISSSALCGSCHTVILPRPTGEVVEQATYLEWRASELPAKNQPCQYCHVPAVDDAGRAISTPIASFPASLAPRQPIGRHTFVGGNSYILTLLADAIEWSGVGIDASELLASAARDDAHLATAARLTVTDSHREGGSIVATVRVENLTGHKLPTGYPSRRVWLHVTARNAGNVVFESGNVATLTAQPHRDEITAPEQAQVWEATLVDAAGQPTHRALDARRYGKDDRILPKGFAPTSTDRARTAPVGVAGDASFVAGSDDVMYRFAAPAGTTIEIELLYQALRPEIVDAIEASATPAGSRFVDLARARPVTPIVIARTTSAAL
ncbi:MAG TPA: hypothetical protein VFV99_21620 [Kofleriaceae bacterium]|nr:hypothetical protein [Kofleriaceae bacterium]